MRGARGARHDRRFHAPAQPQDFHLLVRVLDVRPQRRWGAACAACGETATGETGGWEKAVEGAPDRPDDAPPSFRDVQGNGDPAFARRRLTQMCDDPDTVLIALAKEDGGVSLWHCAGDADQREWALRKLDEIAVLLQKDGQ